MRKLKFRIVETQGCIAGGVTVNDKDLNEISQEEQDEILDYLLLKIKEQYRTKQIDLMSIVNIFEYTDYEYDREPCDSCGDTVSTTTWDIEVIGDVFENIPESFNQSLEDIENNNLVELEKALSDKPEITETEKALYRAREVVTKLRRERMAQDELINQLIKQLESRNEKTKI